MATSKDDEKGASKQIMTDRDFPTAARNVADKPVPGDDGIPVDLLAERRGFLPASPEYWKFAAAKAQKGWGPGQLVTEKEFDEAIEAQAKTTIR